MGIWRIYPQLSRNGDLKPIRLVVAHLKTLFLLKLPNNRLQCKKSKKGKTMEKVNQERFIVSVKVGPKGQITIPAEARKMFDIKEGETLMVMGDKEKGIAILKADQFYSLMEGKR